MLPRPGMVYRNPPITVMSTSPFRTGSFVSIQIRPRRPSTSPVGPGRIVASVVLCSNSFRAPFTVTETGAQTTTEQHPFYIKRHSGIRSISCHYHTELGNTWLRITLLFIPEIASSLEASSTT